MKIYSCKDYDAASKISAEIIARQILEKPDCVLGLATGSSPIGLYKELIKKNQKGEITFKDVKSINLDEYCGLTPDNDQSYRYFMNTNLFDHVDINKDNTNVPDGTSEDFEGEPARYDALVEFMGGIDLQLLGIGNNGHVGFNEPSDSFPKNTSRIKLTDSTIEANKRFFENKEDVPKYAYTLGLKGIINAGKILLIANGAGKAEIIEKAFFGPVTPQVPASVLQLVEDKVIVVLDSEAAAVVEKNHPEAVTKI